MSDQCVYSEQKEIYGDDNSLVDISDSSRDRVVLLEETVDKSFLVRPRSRRNSRQSHWITFNKSIRHNVSLQRQLVTPPIAVETISKLAAASGDKPPDPQRGIICPPPSGNIPKYVHRPVGWICSPQKNRWMQKSSDVLAEVRSKSI